MKNEKVICCGRTGEVLYEEGQDRSWGELEAFARKRFKIENEKVLHPVRLAYLVGGIDKGIQVLAVMVDSDTSPANLKREMNAVSKPVIMYEGLRKHLKQTGMGDTALQIIMQALTTSPLMGKTYIIE